VKIGHGPATVIGKRNERMPRVRNVPEPVKARALRERERGCEPRHFREAFLLERILQATRKLLGCSALESLATSAILLALAIPAGAQSTRSSESPDDAKQPATRTVIDDNGRKVAIPVDVRRVVSLAPNLTETIYALGLEDKLVGDSDYCDTPPAAKLKPHVGGTTNPNIEAIVASHPDLVLASAINPWDAEHSLEHLAIPVYGSDPQSVEQMLASTRRIAEILGADEKGAALTAQLEARLNALKEKLADQPMVHVLFVVWMDPLITTGQNTFISDALRWAGAESVVTSDQKWPHVSFEEIVRVQPEYIVLTPDHQESNAEGLADLRSRAGWKDLEAVETGHVITISAAINRPSPGMIEAIEQAAHVLHPEAFAGDAVQKAAQTELKPSSGPQSKQHDASEQECAACAH